MNAKKDPNFVNTLTGTLNTDGQTIILIGANPLTHALNVNDGISGTDFGPINAPHDANDVHTLLATSSADGKTPVVVYADINGNLLIDSH
jgi:hypothetical protein